MKTKTAAMISAAFSCAGTGLSAWLAGTKADAGSILSVLAAVCLLGWLGWFFWRQKDRRLLACFGTAGAVLVLLCALGARLHAADRTGWDGLAASLLTAALLGPAAGGLLILCKNGLERLHPGPTDLGCRTFWLVFGLLCLCWLPYVLAFFPGVTGYDMDSQVGQLATGEYSAQHPLLHTLFIGLCMKIGGWLFGSTSVGYGIQTVVQVLLLASSAAYAMKWLMQRRCPRPLWLGILAFLALSPQHGVMSVSGTKDILFAAGMLVMTVELLRMLTEPERTRSKQVWLADVLLLAAVGMLRKNAVYAVLMLGAVYWIICRRKSSMRLVALLAAGAVAAMGCMSALQAATGARDGSIREMLSVPCQQLARIHAVYGLDVPAGYEVREVLPEVDRYAPERADFTKHSARVTTPDRLVRFAKLWAREAFSFPIEYIDAFLLNTKGFWDLADTSFATTYDEIPGQPIGCMTIRHNENTDIELLSAWPAFREMCMRLFAHNEYMRFPVLWQLLHPALYTWLMIFVSAWIFWRRRYETLPALGLLAAYLLTLLFGPCALIRYSYYLMLSVPVLIAFVCCQNPKGEKQ